MSNPSRSSTTISKSLSQSPSLTPSILINIEGVRDGDCDRLFDIVVELLDGFDKLVIPTK